jgi:hypothetical protein
VKSLEIDRLEINSKPVYIFENHSLAFKVWLNIKQTSGILPFVISLDHHTDTVKALSKSAFYEWNNTYNNYSPEDGHHDRYLNTHLYSLDLSNEEQVNSLLLKLAHDEHIDAAIKMGIISHSISIQWQNFSGTSSIEQDEWHLKHWRNQINNLSPLELGKLMRNPIPYPEPPFNYKLPENKMFIIGYPNCECPKSPHDEICDKHMYDNALESSFLDRQLNIVENLQENINQRGLQPFEFILDIDLDYFHTVKSVSPKNREKFSWLVRNSLGITIAKESACVDSLKCEGENINSEYLLRELLKLIEKCL